MGNWVGLYLEGGSTFLQLEDNITTSCRDEWTFGLTILKIADLVIVFNPSIMCYRHIE